ncbi:MAG: tetraacyldisaccharide 4'-kinase [Elusimicrobiota bacterium]
MNWEIRRNNLNKSPAGRAILWTLSCFFGAAVFLRRWLYLSGILPSKRLSAKVICIGNITTGGTGKTPTVLLAAQTIAESGVPVSIISRGYGRKNNGKEVVLLDDKPPHWTECGDEPWMMHHSLLGRGIPILVSSNRLKAGIEAVTFYHSKAIILDDGFQHLKLKRDLDIVLVNAADPFGEKCLLPRGRLREPLSGLARAGLILLTHVNRATPIKIEELRREIATLNPHAPIVESIHEPDFLLDLKSQKKYKPGHILGENVAALSGLGDPAQFEDMLERMGAHVDQKWRYPDHHPYTAHEIKSIEKLRQNRPVVTTLKDMTRFPKDWETVIGGGFFALAIKLTIVNGRQDWSQALSLASQ